MPKPLRPKTIYSTLKHLEKNRRRRGTQTSEEIFGASGGSDVITTGDGADFVVRPFPCRKDYHRRRQRFPLLLGIFAPLAHWMEDSLYSLRKRLRAMQAANRAALLGYVPAGLFLGISLITLGLYPYIWMRSNIYALVNTDVSGLDEQKLNRFAVTGFCVQLLFVASAAACLWAAWITHAPADYELAYRLFIFFLLLYILAIFPQRCSVHFDLRWSLRRKVAAWDKDSIMISRTASSWLKLFLLGSLYIQHHINRLMGLGMPGFADSDEIEEDEPILKRVRKYVQKENHSPVEADEMKTRRRRRG